MRNKNFIKGVLVLSILNLSACCSILSCPFPSCRGSAQLSVNLNKPTKENWLTGAVAVTAITIYMTKLQMDMSKHANDPVKLATLKTRYSALQPFYTQLSALQHVNIPLETKAVAMTVIFTELGNKYGNDSGMASLIAVLQQTVIAMTIALDIEKQGLAAGNLTPTGC